MNYYHECCKLYLANVLLTSQVFNVKLDERFNEG